MRIRDLLAAESIELNGSAAGKQDVLNQMVDLMAKSGKIRDVETYRKGVFAREEEGTTGIGEGIAIPHCKSDAVKAPGLAAMVVKDGVEFDALDGAPVNLLFLIAAPNTEDNVHLEVLSKLSVLLMDEDFSRALQNAKSPEEFMKIVDEADQEAPDLDEKLKADEATSEDQFRILAVTACPTGIAHTYMAEENLKKKAKELGVKPMATFVTGALGGVDPSIMGVGPVASTKKALAKANMTIDDMDLIEANEAFAAQSVAVARDLKFDMSKVNVNGGAIALGHPVGASGCRILVTLLHEMQKRDAKKGLATLCIGGGMGCTTIVERD